jgi:hypothetical protein
MESNPITATPATPPNTERLLTFILKLLVCCASKIRQTGVSPRPSPSYTHALSSACILQKNSS